MDEIIRLIVETAGSSVNFASKGRAIRNLAEAWAWLASPGQPHGGSAAED